MGKKRLLPANRTQQHLSPSQEDVFHLWPLAVLCRSKTGALKVVQKTTDETAIVPQRLRNQFTPANRGDAASQKRNKKLKNYLKAEWAKSNYGLRPWSLPAYTDPDVLWSEDLTYCSLCKKHLFGICSLHLRLVINREVVRDGSVEERARLTVPWPLYVAKSKIPGAGEGVWTSASLPRGLVFGPYEGQILRAQRNSSVADSGYAWHLQVKSHKKTAVYVDSVDKSISNWLRYVNCARDTTEINLEAFQYKMEVYYTTLKEIESNSELLVWYGDEYGKELGIRNLYSNKISMSSAQDGTPTVKSSSKANPHHDQKAPSNKNRMQLSKSQSSLEHLFLPARLEPDRDHNVRVVYISSTNNNNCTEENSESSTRKQVASLDKPPYLPSVGFNQKYNCKYNHAYCVECRKTYSSLCPKHPMTLILDNQVLRDGSIENRAQLTAPWPLYIANSKIEDAGQGVWTSAALPQGLVFGPCEGRIIKKTGKMSGYSWEVRGRPDIEIDAEETSVSNWVRYINCARNYVERNLIAMQIQNEIFYVTKNDIERNTELMVWYGAAYASWLGISTKDFFKPQLNEAELTRWCSECEVLFCSTEFLSRHKERCGQNKKRKCRKRNWQDTDSSPKKHFMTEWKSQEQDKEKTRHQDVEENMTLEAEGVLSQNGDLDHTLSRTESVCYSDKTRTTSLIFEQSASPCNTEKPQNNNPKRFVHKPQCSRINNSNHALVCINSQAATSYGSDMFKPSQEKGLSHICHEHSLDKLHNAKPLHHDTRKPHTDVSVCCSLSKLATSSRQMSNTSPFTPQNSPKVSSQFSSLDSSEIINPIPVDSDFDLLDDSLNHNSSLHVDDSTLPGSAPQTAVDYHGSNVSDTVSSGYSSISSLSHSSNCDHNDSGSISHMPPSNGILYSSHESAQPQQQTVSVSTSTEKSYVEGEIKKTGYLHKTNGTSSTASDVILHPHKTGHSSKSDKWVRKCSCHYGRRALEYKSDVTQRMLKCQSKTSNSCSLIPDAIPPGTFMRKGFRNTSLHFHWRSRKVIDYRCKRFSHAAVVQHGLYHNTERKSSQSGEMHMVGVTQTLFHPPKHSSLHINECRENQITDICPEFGENETTVGITVKEFYGQVTSNQMSHENMAERRNNSPRQEKQYAISSHLQQANPRLHQAKSAHQETCNMRSNSKQSVNREHDTHAGTQPAQCLKNKGRHCHSGLCTKNGSGTLYECKCGRKFLTKYNLHEHQYSCMQ